MNRYINIAVSLLCAAFIFTGCAEQDVASVESTEGNAVLTIEPAEDYTDVKEGDTLVFNIVTSKMLGHAVGLNYEVTSMEADVDFSVVSFSEEISSYRTSASLEIAILEDGYPELEEDFVIRIYVDDLAWDYQLSQASDFSAEFSYAISNVNVPDILSVGFAWEDPTDYGTDFDLLVEYELGSWSADGGTSANPEIDNTVGDDAAGEWDGMYYYGIDPYHVPEGDINFTLSVGYPDGRVEVFEGVFNVADVDTYNSVYFGAWGIDIYTLLEVNKTGNTFDVSYVF